MNKCRGCGAILQTINETLEGYTKDENSELCERCFRIQHYHDYRRVLKTNQNFLPILEKINKSGELVIVVVDLFHTIPLDKIKNVLSNDIILVLTKRDILPYSLYEEKIIKYFEKEFSHVKKTIVVSSKNNYHYDKLYQAIKTYQKGNKTYVVGFTNAGKSTMINNLIYHYTDKKSHITTSLLPSTTLNTIEIKLNDNCTLIDTPGLLEEESMIHFLEGKDLKKIIPKKEIKPRIYQVHKNTYFKLDSIMRLQVISPGNIVFYFSNELKIERLFKEPKDISNYYAKELIVEKNKDIVFKGIGFIKVTENIKIKLWIKDNIKYYIRDSYI